MACVKYADGMICFRAKVTVKPVQKTLISKLSSLSLCKIYRIISSQVLCIKLIRVNFVVKFTVTGDH